MYGEAPPPAPVYEPAYNAEGEYVDASDRESVRSAREDYEEALEAANDSSASSSDIEELEEAREEYEASGHLWAGMAPTIRNPGPYTDFLTSVVKVCFSHTSLEIIDL